MILADEKYIKINQILFSIVNTYESRLSKEKENKNGLSISEKGIIMILGQLGIVNSKTLSRIMDINPGTISLYVERLVKKALVERRRDEKDRRNWLLLLTRKGKKEYEETCLGSVEYTSTILEVLTQEEQEKLFELLDKVSEHNNYEW